MAMMDYFSFLGASPLDAVLVSDPEHAFGEAGLLLLRTRCRQRILSPADRAKFNFWKKTRIT